MNFSLDHEGDLAYEDLLGEFKQSFFLDFGSFRRTKEWFGRHWIFFELRSSRFEGYEKKREFMEHYPLVESWKVLLKLFPIKF